MSNQGRVEIKFLTDIKELDKAKKSITDLSKVVEKALDGDGATGLADSISDVGTEATTTAKKVDELEKSIDGATQDKNGRWRDANGRFLKMGNEADVASKQVDGVTQSVDKLVNETNELGNSADLDQLSDGVEEIGTHAEKSTGGVKNLVGALGLLKVAGVAIQMITSSIDDAVGRVDTMNQYPKMLQQMGFSAEDSERSINSLSEGIQGLPTRLNDVVATTQRFTTAFRDVDLATETTLALNNALLASGADAQAASNSIDQYVKVMSSGKLEMDSWNTLSETMGYALTEVSAQMGYSAESTWELYDALKSGEVTLDDLNSALIEASTAQGGFAELALTASEGLATSWSNIRTAVVTGVANVIQATDDLVKDLTGKNIAQHFDGIKSGISGAFNAISTNIRSATPYIRSSIALLQRWAPAIVGVATAYTSLKVIQSVGGWIDTANKAIKGAEVAKKGLTLATKAMTAEEIASAGALSATQTIYGVMTGQISALTLAKQGLAMATNALTSPLGLVVSSLALVAGGAVFAYNKLSEVTDETQAYIDELSGIAEENDKLITSVENSGTAFSDNITDIESNRTALKDLADEIVNLAGKEEKSAQDKVLLKGKIDTLNGALGDTIVAYDEETDSLNMSTEAIYARIDAMTDVAKAEAAQERLKEIFKEQLDLQAQINKNMQEIQTGGQAGNEVIQTTGYQELIDDTNTLKQSYNDLTVEAQNTEAILANSMDGMATITEESTNRQIIAFEDLEQAQQDTITNLQDYYTGLKDHTTDMFNEIDDTIMTTTDVGDEVAKTSEQIFDEMQTTLEHNQEVVATWADNMSELANRGVDEGLLQELSRLGPEGAPYVQALVDASDEELSALSETFSEGGQEALDALQESLGLEDFELEGLEGIITKAETSLSEQIEDSGLSELGGTIVEKIGDGIAEADTTEISESLGTTIIEQIPEWINDGGESISEAGKGIVDNIGTGIQSADSLQESVNLSVEEIPEWINEKTPEMEEAGKNLMDGATSGVDNNKAQLSESTQTAATEALDSFKSASGVASPSTLYAQAAADIVAGAVNGINDNKATLASVTQAMASESVSSFIKGSEGAYNAGVQLAEGFRSGLASRRNSIINTATGIANAATAAINKALVVKSPSRKGFYSGSMLGKGVQGGMEDEIPNTERMAARLADSAIPEIKPIDINNALSLPYFKGINGSPMSRTSQSYNDSEMLGLLNNIANKETNIVLEDGTLVGKLGPKFDRHLGGVAKNKQRYGGATI